MFVSYVLYVYLRTFFTSHLVYIVLHFIAETKTLRKKFSRLHYHIFLNVACFKFYVTLKGERDSKKSNRYSKT